MNNETVRHAPGLARFLTPRGVAVVGASNDLSRIGGQPIRLLTEVGSKGQVHVEPAYEYAEGLEYELTIEGRSTRKRIGKRDQFAPQLLYFSDCILKNRTPEPSGEEGMQDVRIVEAIHRSARTGKAVKIPPFEKRTRPTGRQRIVRPGVRKPRLVKVQAASE